MAAKLTTSDVKHIAKLANLTLTEAEVIKFQGQLSDVLDYFEILKKVNTDNIEETHQVTGLKNIYKDDLVGDSFSQKDALSNADKTHDGYFVVPAVINKK